mgnify:CR=1 FL=1
MTLPSLDLSIMRALKNRRDIWIDDAVSANDGAPEIRGVKLRRVKETEVRGPESYHPYTHVGWYYFGQAFAIEVDIAKGRNPLTKKQLEWRGAFEAAGGAYIEARALQDVFDVLGKDAPEPWGDLT